MSIFSMRAVGSLTAPADQPIDRAQVERALDLFLDGAQHAFLFALPSNAWVCLRGCYTEELINWIADNSAGSGVYFGINPIVEIARPSRVGDVVRRRWILVDVDRDKTLQPNDPATDNEHDAAFLVANKIATQLSQEGFPVPVHVDSANGHHLYYRIDLPNDAASRDLVHYFLKSLAGTFGKAIGAECFDARRISRIPGTWSRRGEASPERPYRQCKFTLVPPDDGEIVTAELLRGYIIAHPPPAKAAKASAEPAATSSAEPPSASPPAIPAHVNVASVFSPVATNSDEDARIKAYVEAAIKAECEKLGSALPGNRNNQLFASAAALWELVAGKLTDEATILAALWAAARACGLDKDPAGEAGIKATIESARQHGMQQPRAMPAAEVNGQYVPVSGERVIILASEITPCSVAWLWQGRIPLGKLTTFAGGGGLGKSFVLLDIAARVTTGGEWPDGTSGNMAGKVLYISGEDDPEDTLVPRLIATGGIREKVAFFKPEYLGKFTLANIPLLDAALDQLGEDTLMVCIDPPTSFLGNVDDHKNAELRALLTPLSEWATRRKVSVVFITHINKGVGKIEAMMRIIGSVAWSNAVRAAHMFMRDPEDDEKRIFIGVKITAAKERKGMAYKITPLNPLEIDGPAKVEWLGEVEISANEAMQGSEPKKKMKRGEAAAEWLIKKFREKNQWYSEDLFKDAKEENISRNAIFEAKQILNMPKARKEYNQAGIATWVWEVPPDWPPLHLPGEENQSEMEF